MFIPLFQATYRRPDGSVLGEVKHRGRNGPRRKMPASWTAISSHPALSSHGILSSTPKAETLTHVVPQTSPTKQIPFITRVAANFPLEFVLLRGP